MLGGHTKVVIPAANGRLTYRRIVTVGLQSSSRNRRRTETCVRAGERQSPARRGSTVPFIARTARNHRHADDAAAHARGAPAHCGTATAHAVLESIRSQGKPTRPSSPDPRRRHEVAVADIYSRTAEAPHEAAIAREAASSRWPTACSTTEHEPLPPRPSSSTPEGVADAQAALDGARSTWSNASRGRRPHRRACARRCGQGRLASKVRAGKTSTARSSPTTSTSPTVHEDALHRILAMSAGERGHPRHHNEAEELRTTRRSAEATTKSASREVRIAAKGRPATMADRHRRWRAHEILLPWDRPPHAVRQSAETRPSACSRPPARPAAAAPAGTRATMASTGFRTGSSPPSSTPPGKVVATEVIYPHQPQNQWDRRSRCRQARRRAQGRLNLDRNGTASRRRTSSRST